MHARIIRGPTEGYLDYTKPYNVHSLFHSDYPDPIFFWGIKHFSESVSFYFIFFELQSTGSVLDFCRVHALQSTGHTTLLPPPFVKKILIGILR